MAEIDKYIENASQLPLADAAYLLWKNKWFLDNYGGQPDSLPAQISTSEPVPTSASEPVPTSASDPVATSAGETATTSGSPSTPGKLLDVADQAGLQKVVRRAIEDVVNERKTAHDGPTFQRLKAAHPEPDAGSLERAITAAVKLENDLVQHFSWDHPEQSLSVAKEKNPGFKEETYRLALFKVMTDLR